jgi:hypothetical protein
LNLYLTILVFYVPACDTLEEITEIITQNGGIVSDFHECFTIQLKPNGFKDMSAFYHGDIHAWSYIPQSIKNLKLEPL